VKHIPILALVVYIVHAIAWPFDLGRDGGAFLQHYFDVFEADPVLPSVASYRTPLPSLWYGLLLDYAGAWLAELVQAAAYVFAVVCAYRIGRPWGRGLATALALTVIAHPFYGALYHRVDSDGMFAFVLIAWVSYAISTAGSRRLSTWMTHALWIFALVMTRPAAVILAPFALLPLALVDRPWAVRARQAAVCVSILGALLAGYSAVNYSRFGFFGLTRITNATQPFMRLMVKDRLVHRGNGPASAELASAIEQQLLPYEPYRGLNMTADELLQSGSVRLYSDVVAMSDRIWGWDTNYRKLRDVSIESVRANPSAFVFGAATTFVHSLVVRHAVAAPKRRDGSAPAATGASAHAADGDIVPYPYQDMWSGTPDHRYDPGVANEPALARFREQHARVELLSRQLPVRNGSALLSAVLNTWGLLFTPMILAVIAGVMALPFMFVTADPRERILMAIFLLSLALLAATFAGQVPVIVQYRLPLDPVFLAAGMVGAAAIYRGRRVLGARGYESIGPENAGPPAAG
jgi:hypothetical protein